MDHYETEMRKIKTLLIGGISALALIPLLLFLGAMLIFVSSMVFS